MMLFHPNMQYLFKAKSIAIIDSATSIGASGQIVLGNLQKAKFTGNTFYIHDTLESINDIPCLRNISAIEQEHLPLELGVICTPKDLYIQSLESLGKCGTKAAIIIDNLHENATEKVLLHQEIKNIADKYGMAVVGPKSLGTICMYNQMDTTTSPGNSQPGNIGFFSQSEAMCITMFNWLENHHSGFSSFISLGTKSCIDEADAIAYLAKDEKTRVITGHLESINLHRPFLENAQLATVKKPVIILKSGRSPMGTRVASAHSGASCYDDFVYEAIFKQTGIIRAQTTEDLFALATAFASQPLPKGNSVAILTNDGGTGVLAADACDRLGLNIAELSTKTVEALAEILPTQAYLFNPVNTLSSADKDQIGQALDIILQDKSVHSVVVLLTSSRQMHMREIAEHIVKVNKKYDKTVITSLLGSFTAKEGKKIFIDAGLPCYPFPETAMSVLATMYKQSLWKDSYTPVEINYRHDATKAKKAIASTRAANRLEMNTEEAQNLLQAYEIPILETKLATTSDQAVQMAKQLGLPVALKIASPDIESKGEVGGVILNIASKEKVRSTFTELTNKFMREQSSYHIKGCLVQSMAPFNSREVSLGLKKVPNVGTLVRFSLGGIHAEIFKDVAWRIAPLSLDDVYAMTREIQAFPILAGGHGQNPVDFKILEDMLLILSQISRDLPEISELSLDPVMVNEDSAYVLDMRVVLDAQGTKQ